MDEFVCTFLGRAVLPAVSVVLPGYRCMAFEKVGVWLCGNRDERDCGIYGDGAV